MSPDFMSRTQAVADFQSNIKLDLMQDRHTSYFTKAMEEAYASCQADAGMIGFARVHKDLANMTLGTGVKNRSFATFATHLKLTGKHSPFYLMTKSLSKALEDDSKQRVKEVSRRAEDILREIYCQFEDMVDQKVDDGAEKELRRELRTFLEDAEMKFTKAKDDLEKLKGQYPQ